MAKGLSVSPRTNQQMNLKTSIQNLEGEGPPEPLLRLVFETTRPINPKN